MPVTHPAPPPPPFIHPLQWAMAACGALLAMLSAHWGYATAYAWFKPLTMVLAMACVGVVARNLHTRSVRWLMAGLALSMVGDVCLLTPAGFIPGLVAFLLAHVCYIALFQRDAPWQPHHGALAICLAIGMLAYAYLWTHGLPAALRVPVAAYVLVIALMAAQAIGRANVLRTSAARTVAWGAVSFTVSDGILGLDKFVQPIAGVSLWVLGTYYVAQWLMVHGMLQTWRSTPFKNELSALSV